MQKHITDQPRHRTYVSRAKAFLTFERQSTRHPSYTVLHRQPKVAGSGTKARQFARIERGILA